MNGLPFDLSPLVYGIKVRRMPFSQRRKAVFGYKVTGELLVTDVGWNILHCDDEDERKRLWAEANLLEDLDVAADQLGPFRQSLEAFGVALP